MNLKELRSIVAMLDNMPEETLILVDVITYEYDNPIAYRLQNAFMPNLKSNKVKLFTEAL